MATYVDTVGDIFRVTMAFTYADSQVEECTIHYRVAVAGTGDSRLGLLGYADTGVLVYLLPRVPATASYYGSEISAAKTAAPWGPKVSYSGVVGGSAFIPLPTQTRGLISWKTALAGRAYRGRTYLPSTTIDNLTAPGKPTAAAVTSWAGWATYMVAPAVVSGTTWVPGVFHRKPTAVIASVFDPFTSFTASNQFATQRRSGMYGRVNGPPF